MSDPVRLYHGTTEAAARVILTAGWRPNSAPAVGRSANPAIFSMTNTAENARCYACEKGGDVVLVCEVPRAMLALDPDGSVGRSVAEELGLLDEFGLAGSVAVTAALAAGRFSRLGMRA